VLGALSQIHVANLLHFDLKPSNILFSDTDVPMIADFGQARLIDPSGLAAAPKMYKWGIPPEVLTHHVGTVESDIYQAGLTLYRLFNGEPHFKLQCSRLTSSWAEAIEKGRLPDRGNFLPHISPGIRRVIRRALKVNPTQRYHSAIEFQDALSRLELPLNWTVHLNSAIQTTWTAHRQEGPDLEVQQLFDTGTGYWRVKVHTLNGGSRRRKGVDSFWADKLGNKEVDDHLQNVFSELG
jgi:serine/threonine protein kinase